MKKVFKVLAVMLILAIAAPIITPIADTAITAQAATVKLNKTKLNLDVGEVSTLKITGTKKTVKWTSSNKKIATINKEGKVKGIKRGTATITAEVAGKKYTSKVSVVNRSLYPISENGKEGFINKTGKVVVKPKYENVWSFSEGLAIVELDGKYGFINKTGKEVVKPKYDYVYNFSEGLAGVRRLDGKTGYINNKGKIIYMEK